ncbi:MAG: winged helix-turn-helix transcriptional regulator [Bacteroidetes bacterium SB0662_bin_6]|nr:winged helix-turn-helix transcriptional regulator [Bacteroidetes bacterium SB0668_bin_1]MYE05173.1 winged helix-turn-helix transcriptional regulator [Bacteroidetes bacterium SB0662_bin_6]
MPSRDIRYYIPLRIFISSVQKEFAGEREMLADYLCNDPLIRRCVAASLREPEFVASGGFVTTIRRPDYATQLARVQAGVQEGVQAGGQPELQPDREEARRKTRGKTRRKTREKILALIAADSSITIKELANRLEITPKGIEWQIREMKRMGIFERIGPARGGYWKIMETDNE